MDELDFGVVNVDKFRTIKVFLTNVTEPTARWKLNYVSFPKKQTIGYSTLTPWEQENMEKTDDPDAFEFSGTDVRLYKRFLRCVLGYIEREILAIKKSTRRSQCSTSSKG